MSRECLIFWILDVLAYICKKKAMRYASQDFMDNLFGRYTPAKMMVKNRARKAQEEIEAKEAEGEHECSCKK
jgi:hypothetical protein